MLIGGGEVTFFLPLRFLLVDCRGRVWLTKHVFCGSCTEPPCNARVCLTQLRRYSFYGRSFFISISAVEAFTQFYERLYRLMH